mgnify:CR=1 FL=1
MPDVEENKQDLVDIDTSGPGAEVDIEETKEEVIVEETKEEPKVVEEKVEASDEKQETKKEEPKEELEQYSEGVQKRIAKLTKKWREAERQKEAALEFAKGGQAELEQLKTNSVFIGACLFPFVCSALGIVLLIYAELSIETNILIDRYISWIALLASFLFGIIYLSIRLKKNKKLT